MIGFVLLLTGVSIILTNGIPIEIDTPYSEYPEEYKESYKTSNYFNPPKTSYELRPQSQSCSKRDKTGPNYLEMMKTNNQDYKDPRREQTRNKSKGDGLQKNTSTYDDWRYGKRSFKSQELHEKLIALGLDYIEASNIIESLHQFKQKIDDKNYLN